MNVKIEKGIPLPPERAARNAWPFVDMDVGDSFLVDGVSRNTVHVMAYKAGIRLARKFSAQKVKDGQWRVWRRV